MASANDVLNIARGEIGYSRWDDPAEGTKYGRWYADLTGSPYFGTSGVPYCAMFASWVLAQAGQSMPGFPGAYCPTMQAAARGQEVAKTSAQPGDIVFFTWYGDPSSPDHVGIVEANCGSYVQTIEGNTSPGSSGSQGNGGGVYRRTRDWSVVASVHRPAYVGGGGSTGGLAVDGIWGEATTRALQARYGTPVDGIVSSQDAGHRAENPGLGTGWEWLAPGTAGGSQLIVAMQKDYGVTADGLIGPTTINAIIERWAAESGSDLRDGRFDNPSITVMAMQRALNEGRY